MSNALVVGTIRYWKDGPHKKTSNGWKYLRALKKQFWEMTPGEFETEKKRNPDAKGLSHERIILLALRNGLPVPEKLLLYYPHLHEMWQTTDLEKAKKLPIGTVRYWKKGRYIKDRPHHWRMLHEIVQDRHTADAVHGNTDGAKMMQSAARALLKHAVNMRGEFTPEAANKFLVETYGHLEYDKFGLWKKRVYQSVEKYLRQVHVLAEGGRVRNKTKIFQDVQKWQDDLTAAAKDLKDVAGLDQWVIDHFSSRRKNIAHILYAAREVVGRETPLKLVPNKGFRGFCKAIIEKLYEHGPSGISREEIEKLEKAFSTFFKNATSGNSKAMPLEKALTHASSKAFFRQNPKWFVYCCTRQALKNDGQVDLSSIEVYMQRAMKYHGTKNPPAPDYDDPHGVLRTQYEMGLRSAASAIKHAPKEKVKKIKKVFFKLRKK